MPPKKATKATKASEKTSARKPAAKEPGLKPKLKTTAKLAPPPPQPPSLLKNPSKKRKSTTSSDPRSPTPEWDKNITTNYQRAKKRYKISMKNHEVITEDDIAALASQLQGGSRNTWGETSNQPILAGRRPKTKRRPHLSDFDIAEMNYMSMMDAMRTQTRQPVSNDPARTPILRVPLEVRERIYGFFFKSKKPILVKADWVTVEYAGFEDVLLLFVCKQFNHEVASYIFRNNSITSALLPPPINQFRRFDEPPSISPDFLSLYRNIAIDCSKDCWNLDYYKIATVGLNKLVDAKACIEELKLVFAPKRVGMSSTALGMEAEPITFADFLWYEGKFMEAVRKLAPKDLTIVIKKEERKMFIIDVDMRDYRRARELKVGPLVTEEMLRVTRQRANVVKMELLGLKDRYEEVFENHWKALNDGKCRFLSNNTFATGSGTRVGSQPWSHDLSFASSSGDMSGPSSGEESFTSRPEDTPEALTREETLAFRTRDTSQPSSRGLSFVSETEERDPSPHSTEWPDSEDGSAENGNYGMK